MQRQWYISALAVVVLVLSNCASDMPYISSSGIVGNADSIGITNSSNRTSSASGTSGTSGTNISSRSRLLVVHTDVAGSRRNGRGCSSLSCPLPITQHSRDQIGVGAPCLEESPA
jgi:hypothetical protein